MQKIKTEVKWALIFVGMTLAWMVLEKVTGMTSTNIDKHYIFTNFIAIPAIAVYVFALLDKKKKDYSGTMSYKQGLISGLIITAIVTVLSPLTQYITSAIIVPEYFPNIIKHVVAAGMMKQADAEAYFNLQSYIMQGLIGAPVMGLITTAIVAIFTRSKTKS